MKCKYSFYLKYSLRILFAAVLLTGMIALHPQAARLSFPHKAVLTAYKKPVCESMIVAGLSEKGRIVGLRSSDKNVLTVSSKYDEDLKVHEIYMKARKAGTAKVSFTAKIGNTSKKFICNVTVKKYVSPFRSIKVSGKSIASKMKKSNIVTLDYRRKKEKVTLKLKKNWEIETMYFDNGDWTEDAILNRLEFESNHGGLGIVLFHKKTGQYEDCYIKWK